MAKALATEMAENDKYQKVIGLLGSEVIEDREIEAIVDDIRRRLEFTSFQNPLAIEQSLIDSFPQLNLRKAIVHVLSDSEGQGELKIPSLDDINSAVAVAEKNGIRGETSVLPPDVSSEDFARALAEDPTQYSLRVSIIGFLNTIKDDDALRHYIDSQHIRVKLLIANRLLKALHEEGGSSLGQLKEHQIEGFEATSTGLEDGMMRQVTVLPTGVGKTATFCTIASIAKVKTLILLPKLNLFNQTKKSLQRFGGIENVTEYNGDTKDTSGDVVLCTYDSLQTLINTGTEFPLVILDEAHRGLAEKRSVDIGRIPGKVFQSAFTASQEFSDEKNVEMLGTIVHTMHITEAIEDGLIAGAVVVRGLTKTKIDTARNQDGSYKEKILSSVINTPARNRSIIDLLKHPLIGNKTTVVSCVDIAHCNSLQELAVKAGIKAEAVHSDVDEDDNDKHRDKLESGEIQVLFFVNQLTEGWDCPRA